MGDIADGIIDLAGLQRTARPVGEARTLVDRQSQPAFDEIGIADLLGLAERHRGNLGVEQRGGGLAGQVEDDLYVLRACVEDLEDLGILGEQVEQRAQIDSRCLGIDGRGLFQIADLYQAQLGPIGVLAHELGINRDKVGLGQTRAQPREGIGVGNQWVNLHVEPIQRAKNVANCERVHNESAQG